MSPLFRHLAAGLDINARNALGKTPMLIFAGAGYGVVARDENVKIREHVMRATVLDIFVDLGADLAAVDMRDRTLLHVTVARDLTRPLSH
jgi:hypothetical protein